MNLPTTTALATFILVVSLHHAAKAQPHSRRSERIVLVVEVTAFEERRVTPCGDMGAQPRDATARVVSVVEGAFAAREILLAWPVCEWDHITIGAQYQVTIRRFVDGADAPTRSRYLVRSWNRI